MPATHLLKLGKLGAYVKMVSSLKRRDAHVRKVEAASALQLSILLEIPSKNVL